MACEKDVGMGLCTFNFVFRLSLHLVCLLFGTSSLHLFEFFFIDFVITAGETLVSSLSSCSDQTLAPPHHELGPMYIVVKVQSLVYKCVCVGKIYGVT